MSASKRLIIARVEKRGQCKITINCGKLYYCSFGPSFQQATFFDNDQWHISHFI